jgi:hypothetical protein
MSRTEKLEQEARDRRREQTGKLQKWAKELQALGQMLWDEDRQNGWTVQPIKREPQLTIQVMIRKREFARFVRDEEGIVGVFNDGEPERFANRQDAFDAAVKRRIAMEAASNFTRYGVPPPSTRRRS